MFVSVHGDITVKDRDEDAPPPLLFPLALLFYVFKSRLFTIDRFIQSITKIKLIETFIHNLTQNAVCPEQ